MQRPLSAVLDESRAFTRWMIARIEGGASEDMTWEGVLLTFAMACQTAHLDAHKLLTGSEDMAKVILRLVPPGALDALSSVTIDEAERTH